MSHKIIDLEPERTNALLKWWSAPEAATLLECLEQMRQVSMLTAIEQQTKSQANSDNTQFHETALEELKRAKDYEITLRILREFIPNGPFIGRIEL